MIIFPTDFFFGWKKRFTIWHNVFATRDDHIVVFCAHLNHIVKDKWSLVRMMEHRIHVHVYRDVLFVAWST